MTFEVKPDPRHPQGGHALLVVPEGRSTGSGRLTIRRSYDGRYLGAAGWQSAETALGPLDASGGTVALGPDIVGKVDEFDNLEVSFEGGSRGSVVWPGNVLPPPDEATAGGLRRRGQGPVRTEIPVAATGTRAAPPTPAMPVEEPPPPPGPAEPRSSSGILLVVLLVLAVLVVAAALYVFRDDIVEPGQETAGVETTGIACRDDAVAAAGDADPGVLLEWVSRCSGDGGVTPQVRLGVVERLIGHEPAALLVMGRWYDPAHHETNASPFERPSIEIAARYYAEAAGAGAEGAEGLLRDVCARLDPSDFMQNDAIETHCPEE